MISIVIISLVSIIFLTIVTTSFIADKKKEKDYEENEGVLLFGIKMTTADFFSFINTCVSHLMLDNDHELDLKKFINSEFLASDKYKKSVYLIERTINAYPIVSCFYVGNFKYKINTHDTLKKYERYQHETKHDDYIIPIFDMGVIARNPGLFNTPTRYQQLRNIDKILCDSIMSKNFEDCLVTLEKIGPAMMPCDRKKIKRKLTSKRHTSVDRKNFNNRTQQNTETPNNE